jgi:glycerophosphoryl diester phosphodiesterase
LRETAEDHPPLQVTKDGVPVIWHDDTAIWRTQSGGLRSAAAADLTLAEFKALSRSNCACSAGNCLSGALADGCDAPHAAAHQVPGLRKFWTQSRKLNSLQALQFVFLDSDLTKLQCMLMLI